MSKAIMPGVGKGRNPNSTSPYVMARFLASTSVRHEMIQARRFPMYTNILEWLENNVIVPCLVEDEDNANIVNIWYTVLNTESVKVYEPDTRQASRILTKFIWTIQDYIPAELKTSDFYGWNSGIQNSEYGDELVERFSKWYCKARKKLENYIAREYFVKGRMKDCEILKRRYKQDWSESKVVDLTADQNIKVDSDNRLEIRIVDA